MLQEWHAHQHLLQESTGSFGGMKRVVYDVDIVMPRPVLLLLPEILSFLSPLSDTRPGISANRLVVCNPQSGSNEHMRATSKQTSHSS